MRYSRRATMCGIAVFVPHLRPTPNGTLSLTHSLAHSILINLFIKVKLYTLLLPPLLSITFVQSAFYAYVWHILEGTSDLCVKEMLR